MFFSTLGLDLLEYASGYYCRKLKQHKHAKDCSGYHSLLSENNEILGNENNPSFPPGVPVATIPVHQFVHSDDEHESGKDVKYPTTIVEDTQKIECKWERINDVEETKIFKNLYKDEAHKDSLFCPTVAQQDTLLGKLYKEQYNSYRGKLETPRTITRNTKRNLQQQFLVARGQLYRRN